MTQLATKKQDADPIRESAECNACGEGFTPKQWDDRHTDVYGEDVHEECCETCNQQASPT